MTTSTPLRIIAFIFILVTVVYSSLFSQVSTPAVKGPDRAVYKKYAQLDSTAINNSSFFILFSDSSFINYGILKDIQNLEAYVWYTFGKWSTNAEAQIVCNTRFNEFNQKRVIDFIKESYKKRVDHRMIENYYEFVNEQYTNINFALIKNKIVDTEKKIEYMEVKEDSKDITKTN